MNITSPSFPKGAQCDVTEAEYRASRPINMVRTIDPRGIKQTVQSVEWKSDGHKIFYACGHVGTMAPHFDPAGCVGEERFCFECGEEARKSAAAPPLSMVQVIRNGVRPLPKSCPFCGSDAPLAAKVGPRFVVACMNDDCEAIAQASASTPEDAMRIWNRRTP